VYRRTKLLAAVVVVLGLGACEPPAPKRFFEHVPQLARLRLRVPGDVVTTYIALDRWLIASATGYAILDPAPPAAVASPDALRHALEVEQRVSIDIETRESLSDGFAATLVVHAAADQRVTIYVRQLGNQWVRCVGSTALCKSLKRG